MMKLPIYQVDSFASEQFKGNPAAVVPLKDWLPDDVMKNIAAENNLAETAFFISDSQDDYHIRWFTPEIEVDLCGHATLATAYVIFNILNFTKDVVSFNSRSGRLTVKKSNNLFELNFPVDQYEPVEAHIGIDEGLGVSVRQLFKGKSDYMVILDSEEQVAALKPDFRKLKEIPCRGVIVTAVSERVDFVSRFFGPNVGIDEDPVTGSAHTLLAPYWATRLKKTKLKAKQISKRSGYLELELKNDRVLIAGNAVLYLSGEIYIQ